MILSLITATILGLSGPDIIPNSILIGDVNHETNARLVESLIAGPVDPYCGSCSISNLTIDDAQGNIDNGRAGPNYFVGIGYTITSSQVDPGTCLLNDQETDDPSDDTCDPSSGCVATFLVELDIHPSWVGGVSPADPNVLVIPVLFTDNYLVTISTSCGNNVEGRIEIWGDSAIHGLGIPAYPKMSFTCGNCPTF